MGMTELKGDADRLSMNGDIHADVDGDEAEIKADWSSLKKASGGGGSGTLSLHQVLRQKVELNLPSVYLFHGSNDVSCPVSNTKTFSLALANYGVKTFIKIYANQSHTAPIIENPIAGKDPLCCDILQIIYPQQSLTDIVK